MKDIVKRGKVLEYPNYWTFITQRWVLQAEPVLTSPILHDVTVSSKCYIVHGPWYSGKTTLLNALDDSLHYTHRGEGIETSMRGKWPPLYSKKGDKTMDRIRTRQRYFAIAALASLPPCCSSKQGQDEPLHWSLFVARENKLDMVYQVKGDAVRVTNPAGRISGVDSMILRIPIYSLYILLRYILE